jgi:phosphatidylserine decarboxylase
MRPVTPVGAVILSVTAIGMMLFIMNERNSALVRWTAFVIAVAAVGVLVQSYRSLWRERGKR